MLKPAASLARVLAVLPTYALPEELSSRLVTTVPAMNAPAAASSVEHVESLYAV